MAESDDELHQFTVLLMEWDELESADEDERQGGHVGSKLGRKPNIDRNHLVAHDRLWKDYFSGSPTYNDEQFRRRFRMSKALFNRILDDIIGHDAYFVQKADALGRLGLSAHQKITAALRMLAYASPADSLDENLRLAESTILESLQRFCSAVIALYGGQYLRSPNEDDIAAIMKTNDARGFPGMLGSVDCMHWEWKNCPKAWAGMYQGRSKHPTVILEAVATSDLWIWHAFFGMPGSNNDINVLQRSTLFQDFINGKAPSVEFWIKGNRYTSAYLLADGIYPNWPTLVKTISNPVGNKQKLFAKLQEATRKDVERAFGVLQARFRLLNTPCKLWNASRMREVIIACIILHNMIVEDERSMYRPNEYLFDEEFVAPRITAAPRLPIGIETQRAHLRYLHSTELSMRLQRDLIESIWVRLGDEAEL